MGRRGRRTSSGNRDPRIEPGLAALGTGEWDAAIDTSGYLPRCVGASARAIEQRLGHYTFVSSIVRVRGREPSGARRDGACRDARRSGNRGHHGALRRAQGAVRGRDPRGLRHARARRAARAHRRTARPDRPLRLLGRAVRLLRRRSARERPPRSFPAPPDRAVQFIDARDLASWMLDMAEQRVDGTFDACSPAGTWTIGALVDVLVAAARAAGSATVPRWVDDDALVRHEVTPWTGLPLWIPASDAESAGFMHFACARALARGLAIRAAREDGRGHGGVAARARCTPARGRMCCRPTRNATCSQTSPPGVQDRLAPLPCDHSRRHFRAAGRPRHEPPHERRPARIRARHRARPRARPSSRIFASRSTSRTRVAARATTPSPSPITRPNRSSGPKSRAPIPTTAFAARSTARSKGRRSTRG